MPPHGSGCDEKSGLLTASPEVEAGFSIGPLSVGNVKNQVRSTRPGHGAATGATVSGLLFPSDKHRSAPSRSLKASPVSRVLTQAWLASCPIRAPLYSIYGILLITIDQWHFHDCGTSQSARHPWSRLSHALPGPCECFKLRPSHVATQGDVGRIAEGDGTEPSRGQTSASRYEDVASMLLAVELQSSIGLAAGTSRNTNCCRIGSDVCPCLRYPPLSSLSPDGYTASNRVLHAAVCWRQPVSACQPNKTHVSCESRLSVRGQWTTLLRDSPDYSTGANDFSGRLEGIGTSLPSGRSNSVTTSGSPFYTLLPRIPLHIKCFTPTSGVMVVEIEKMRLTGTDRTSAITPRSRGSVLSRAERS
ncbi:hypothetical protein CONLIGDRAFT_648231 [Coniochaeta ligniaria NRRL 30616]|uniref:Uncharacterized protein n=1 Tax=Coniochaeta ligniaria NRRL 30616 TaxID=1408157 RepID=A0A1J7IVQ2_9PEZI|nr:hypothetical protein CONLIGDRAFT_648231 [Coniochaeta ligniaria NRRL 30616]